MGKPKRTLLTLATTGTAALCAATLNVTPALSSPGSESATESASSPVAASPYLYTGWGNPPDPTAVMEKTGIRDFTLAFILSDGTCNPAWDGIRPLDGQDKATISAIRAAGGDVIPSFGGYNGHKLGMACTDARSLAGAYQKVIDAYDLKAIDIDIEARQFENEAAQDRVLKALKIVQQDNPGLKTVVTFPTLADGPNKWGDRLIRRGAELNAGVDVWTIMPFNFGGTNMVQDTVNAAEGLKNTVRDAFGHTDAEAYAHIGISSMNGHTDVGETVTVSDFREIADYAANKGLGRLSFWAVNRDRPCPNGGPASSSCSGVDQQPWAYTEILAGFTE